MRGCFGDVVELCGGSEGGVELSVVGRIETSTSALACHCLVFSLHTPYIALSLAFLLLVSLTHNSLLHSITLSFNYSRVGGCIIFSSFIFRV